jgi:hypothetical protein
MRDLSTNYILRGSWRDDNSQGLAGLGERIAGLEWMAQEHVMEALADPDPRVRVMVAGLLRQTNPAEAMADQATADIVEAAYPTGKPVVFKRFASGMAGRVRDAEAMVAQQITSPDSTLTNIIENADDPEGATAKYMDFKILQAMDPGSFTDEQIDDMFSEDGLLGKSIFSKIKKTLSKVTKPISKALKTVGRIIPAPIRKVIGTVLKITPIGLAATVAKKTFIDKPKVARKAAAGAEREAAAAQAEYDAAVAASTPEAIAAEQARADAAAQAAYDAEQAALARQAAINAQYAAAMNQTQQPAPQYAPPSQGYAAPAPSGGGDYESAQPGEAPVASAAEVAAAAAPAPAESSGGMAAMALAAAAGVGLFLMKGGKK